MISTLELLRFPSRAIRLLTRVILWCGIAATGVANATSTHDLPLAQMGLKPSLLEQLRHQDVRTRREAALVTEAELHEWWGVAAAAIAGLRASLREADLDIGRRPFDFLRLDQRLTLARRGVWSVPDLETVNWDPSAKWIKFGRGDLDQMLALRELARTNARFPINAQSKVDFVPMSVPLSNALLAADVRRIGELEMVWPSDLAPLDAAGERLREELDLILRTADVRLGRTDLKTLDLPTRLRLARAGLRSKAQLRAATKLPEDLGVSAAQMKKVRAVRAGGGCAGPLGQGK